MNGLPLQSFIEAIRATHGTPGKLVAQEHVEETFEGERAWSQDVLTFELQDHPEASLAYAWKGPDGAITVVLGVGPIDSPAKAVRAAILAADDEG